MDNKTYMTQQQAEVNTSSVFWKVRSPKQCHKLNNHKSTSDYETSHNYAQKTASMTNNNCHCQMHSYGEFRG
jgi:hypothetical protein